MAAAGSGERELSTVDIIQYIWLWRWTFALFLLIGLMVSVPLAHIRSLQATKVVTLDLYTDGTPADTQRGLSDQLLKYLVASGYTPVRGAKPEKVIVKLSYTRGGDDAAAEKLHLLKSKISEFEQRIDAKIAGIFADFRKQSPSDLTSFVLFESYLKGRSDGMIDLVRIEARDSQSGLMRALLIILIGLATSGVLAMFATSAIGKRDKLGSGLYAKHR